VTPRAHKPKNPTVPRQLPPLKVGIAGYGIVGKRRRQCIEKHPELRLQAVCDRSLGSPGVFPDGVRHYANYQDLLGEELDVLFVCLTNDVNPDATIRALEGGLHVFCEKPPGRNLDDVARMIRAEKKKPGQQLMFGFNHRYHESVQDALKIVRSGELGEVIHLRGVYGKSRLITFDQSDWRTQRKVAGGGVLLDQGIHMVDLMRLFGGEFTEVQSIVSNSHWKYDVEDNAYALMKTPDGVVAMLNSSATQWRHRFQLDINLEHGSLSLGGLLTGTKSYGDETLTVSKVDHAKDQGDPKEQVTRYNRDPSWELEITNFVESIRSGKPIEHGSSQDAFNTMKLVNRIYYADPRWRGRFQIPNPDSIKP